MAAVRQDDGWGEFLHHQVAIYSNPVLWCQPRLLKNKLWPRMPKLTNTCAHLSFSSFLLWDLQRLTTLQFTCSALKNVSPHWHINNNTHTDGPCLSLAAWVQAELDIRYPPSVLIIPKVDITAKLSVFLPPVFRSPESRRKDRIRCSPDLWPFSYPGSCPSLSGDRPLAFNKTTTLWTNNTYHCCLGLGFPFRKWDSKGDAKKQRKREEERKGGGRDFWLL